MIGKPRGLAQIALVGDIGGTNARFALAQVEDGQPVINQQRSFACADFASLEKAIDAYCEAENLSVRPAAACIAVAGPVVKGAAAMTNLDWRMSEAGLVSAGFGHALLINDFEAQAWAAGMLTARDVHPIGPLTRPETEGALAVLGPGTGMGVAGLLRHGELQLPIAGEGGHVSFAPFDDMEVEIWRRAMSRFGRVSVERLLCGPGLTTLHEVMTEIEGQQPETLPPKIIVQRAKDGAVRETAVVKRFCAMLGSFAGDIALAYGARGGVFIAGGMAPHMLGLLTSGEFRSRFEAKNRFADYMRGIPTLVVMRPDAALLGAMRALG